MRLSYVSIPFGRVSVFKGMLVLLEVKLSSGIMSFHPLWAGLSFQSQGGIPHARPGMAGPGLTFPSPLGGSQFSKQPDDVLLLLHPVPVVSIPFGRVSVFKVIGGQMVDLILQGFHPLWAGLSFQSEIVGVLRERLGRTYVSIPFGRVSVFKADS